MGKIEGEMASGEKAKGEKARLRIDGKEQMVQPKGKSEKRVREGGESVMVKLKK